jgi:hypothetical protein
MLQIARPDGNTFERWKWRHRYVIWTWSLSGVAICLVRLRLDPSHPDWVLASWFTFWSYVMAIPVAVALGALYSTLFAACYRYLCRERVDRVRRVLGFLPGQVFEVTRWMMAIAALGVIALLTVGVFPLAISVFGLGAGVAFGMGWTLIVCLCFWYVPRLLHR